MIRAALALVLAGAVTASGCSLIMVHDAPPEAEPEHWPRCTEHKLFPLVDTTETVLAGGLAVEATHEGGDFASIGLLLAIPAIIGFGASAISGWVQTSRCADARAAYERAAAEGR